MESRAFIKTATKLIEKIKTINPANFNAVELHQLKIDTQKEIDKAFTGLHNPTLPSATKLRDAAINAGFVVDPRVQHRLQQAEGVWV